MTLAERVAQRFLESVVRKEKGKGYCVKSPNNPDWNGGCYPSKAEAEKRLQQVEYFKRQGSDKTKGQRSPHLTVINRRSSVGETTYPADHQFGLKVPKGGSACSKCRFVSENKKHCGSEHFRTWRSSMKADEPSLIPAPADEYCCDVFESA
jgi:hypothetical protein